MERHCPELRQLRHWVSFDLADPFPKPGRVSVTPNRHPACLDLLVPLADGLAEAGYRVGKVEGPGKAVGFGAAFDCELNNLIDVSVLMGISWREDGFIRCVLWIGPWKTFRSYFRLRRRPSVNECLEHFRRLLAAFGVQLETRLRATSIRWLTEDEAADET
jgi:hypothetical protein